MDPQEPGDPQPPAWSDHGAPLNPYAAPSDPYAPPRSAWAEPEQRDGTLPRDLDHEAHVVAIGAWVQIFGALFICFGLFAVAMALIGASNRAGNMARAALGASVLLCISMGLGVTGMLVGGALRTMKNWSRWVYAALLLLSLLAQGLSSLGDPAAMFGVVVSTTWDVAILWALFSERANHLFAPQYQLALRYSPGAPRWVRSPFFWLPFVCCCGFGGLGVVFR